MRKIIKLFRSGNVCVVGLRGRGKDLLMSNVVMRRKLPYISNTNYGGDHIRFHPQDFDCGGNTYDDFINDTLKQYDYPYSDGIDIYVSDAGVYFPSQYCNDLNKKYPYMATFAALSRQLGEANFHINIQNLNRLWLQLKEQSDIYICCNWAKVLFKGKLVIQKITIYEDYDSAVKRVPPFRAPAVRLNQDRKMNLDLAKLNYRIAHGEIKSRILIYRNLSSYDSRIFKSMLAGA